MDRARFAIGVVQVQDDPHEVVFDRIDISDLSPTGVVRLPTTPQVRIPPVYPTREQQQCVEGVCRVVYDVTREGRTTNIDVSDCDSPGFARATFLAVERWRHEPLEGEDDEIAMRGISANLQFTLTQN